MRVFARGGVSLGLATDISPLGCRIVGPIATAAAVGQDLRGELLLPGGSLPVVASVKAVIPDASHDGDGTAALGCEFRWATSDERNQLEMFLFGSDLQWQLNGLSDRIRTPLEKLQGLLGDTGSTPSRRLAAQRWSPILYKRVNAGQGSGVGFISAQDPRTGERTMVSLGVLPRHDRLFAEEVTASGPRGVVGRVADEEVLETHAAPIYLYRLTA
jgi:cellulose synthase (UDP-forming)